MAVGAKLKMGMVGGGPGAFIGEVHRKAAQLDGQIEMVAGTFSSNPRKSKSMANVLALDSRRVYRDYCEMIAKESQLPPEQRIDFVSIVTPNNTHFPIARDLLKAGFHVVCDKPMTMTVAEAKFLRKTVQQTRRLFCLTHNYTGYPMVKLARDMVAGGELGKIRKIVIHYPQGWLATAIEKTGQKQAAWRTDPKLSGLGGSLGDLGSHCENIAEYITGLKIREICAELTSFVKGRKVNDDANCLFRFTGGAKGILHSSQVALGEENGLVIWIYGDQGGLEWHQEEPNTLQIKKGDGPAESWRCGHDYVGQKSPAAARATRLPFGHPEGFIEAFANIYSNFAECLQAHKERRKPDPLAVDYPNVNDGLRGMLFIDTVLASAKNKQKWTRIKK